MVTGTSVDGHVRRKSVKKNRHESLLRTNVLAYTPFPLTTPTRNNNNNNNNNNIMYTKRRIGPPPAE